MPIHEAMFWSSEGDTVSCFLCQHGCTLLLGQVGRCGVRQNREGRLYSLVYGELVAAHVDPIEKKPLFHFLPGSLSFSIATRGCNFHCFHCQNASLSQVRGMVEGQLQGRRRSAQDIVALALGNRCASISYTYVEPTVFYEFAYDCMHAAQEHSLKNVFVTNGYLSSACLDSMAGLLDAANVDIKSFSQSFYTRVCGGKLGAVLDTVHALKEKGIWVEITTLLIPGENDSDEELKGIARFIASLDCEIPWHVTGFYPAFKMQHCSPTSSETLIRAQHIGQAEGLRHVYMGNRPGGGGEDTCCPSCGRVVIRRQGFVVEDISVVAGRCSFCSAPLAGVWNV